MSSSSVNLIIYSHVKLYTQVDSVRSMRHKGVSMLRVLSMIREYFSGKGEDCLKFHGIVIRANVRYRARKSCVPRNIEFGI